jgi:hypothetical protein
LDGTRFHGGELVRLLEQGPEPCYFLIDTIFVAGEAVFFVGSRAQTLGFAEELQAWKVQVDLGLDPKNNTNSDTSDSDTDTDTDSDSDSEPSPVGPMRKRKASPTRSKTEKRRRQQPPVGLEVVPSSSCCLLHALHIWTPLGGEGQYISDRTW